MIARVLVTLAVVFALLSCGPPRYVPFRIVEPRPLSDSAVVTGAVELRLRVGGEWVEVIAVNRGREDVSVDFGRIVLVGGSGWVHELVSGGQISRVASAHLRHGPPDMLEQSRQVSFALDIHTMPAALDRVVGARDLRTLRPGQRVQEILYPAEHLAMDAYRFAAGPLFCRGLLGKGAARFDVLVPVVQANGDSVVRITAELLARRGVFRLP